MEPKSCEELSEELSMWKLERDLHYRRTTLEHKSHEIPRDLAPMWVRLQAKRLTDGLKQELLNWKTVIDIERERKHSGLGALARVVMDRTGDLEGYRPLQEAELVQFVEELIEEQKERLEEEDQIKGFKEDAVARKPIGSLLGGRQTTCN